MSLVSLLLVSFSIISLALPSWNWPRQVSENLVLKHSHKTSQNAPSSYPKPDQTYSKTAIIKSDKKPLHIAASSALVIDVQSGQVLFEKNSQQKLPMASLTKIMTALVIMNHHKPDEIVTIPSLPQETAAGSQVVGIRAGEKFKLAEALRILLIYSANDMANALAIWDSGSIEKFVQKMNTEATWWKLGQSHFVNPTGLDTTDHVSSAADLARLGKILLNSPTFSEIVKTSHYQAKNEAGKTYDLNSTNQLLFTRNDVYGIKTGFDKTAGQCLIALARQNGNSIITVVLNSPDRFAESQNMIEWTFANHTWQ